MSSLENVERLPVQQQVHQKTWFNRNCNRLAVGSLLMLALANANAATVMPEINIADILTYIGLLIAAVATVGSAVLMIYMAAKGIKAIRLAF